MGLKVVSNLGMGKREMDFVQHLLQIFPYDSFSYVDYGTMLIIRDLNTLPDGRLMVDCIGDRRFKVIMHILNYACLH